MMPRDIYELRVSATSEAGKSCFIITPLICHDRYATDDTFREDFGEVAEADVSAALLHLAGVLGRVAGEVTRRNEGIRFDGRHPRGLAQLYAVGLIDPTSEAPELIVDVDSSYADRWRALIVGWLGDIANIEERVEAAIAEREAPA